MSDNKKVAAAARQRSLQNYLDGLERELESVTRRDLDDRVSQVKAEIKRVKKEMGDVDESSNVDDPVEPESDPTKRTATTRGGRRNG